MIECFSWISIPQIVTSIWLISQALKKFSENFGHFFFASVFAACLESRFTDILTPSFLEVLTSQPPTCFLTVDWNKARHFSFIRGGVIIHIHAGDLRVKVVKCRANASLHGQLLSIPVDNHHSRIRLQVARSLIPQWNLEFQCFVCNFYIFFIDYNFKRN